MHSPLARQAALKRALVHALQVGDAPNCWARIVVHGSCPSFPTADPLASTEGDIVRLLSHRDGHHFFISIGKRFDTLQHCMYHLRGDEFVVHWVGEGVNFRGCGLEGRDLEDDFMNRNGIEESDQEE